MRLGDMECTLPRPGPSNIPGAYSARVRIELCLESGEHTQGVPAWFKVAAWSCRWCMLAGEPKAASSLRSTAGVLHKPLLLFSKRLACRSARTLPVPASRASQEHQLQAQPRAEAGTSPPVRGWGSQEGPPVPCYLCGI